MSVWISGWSARGHRHEPEIALGSTQAWSVIAAR